MHANVTDVGSDVMAEYIFRSTSPTAFMPADRHVHGRGRRHRVRRRTRTRPASRVGRYEGNAPEIPAPSIFGSTGRVETRRTGGSRESPGLRECVHAGSSPTPLPCPPCRVKGGVGDGQIEERRAQAVDPVESERQAMDAPLQGGAPGDGGGDAAGVAAGGSGGGGHGSRRDVGGGALTEARGARGSSSACFALFISSFPRRRESLSGFEYIISWIEISAFAGMTGR